MVFGESFDNEVTKEYTIRNQVFTINLVPFGGTRYARIVLVLGLGNGTYSAKETLADDKDSTNNYEYSGSVKGTVSLGQVYGDWGADGFGFRAGFGFLLTNYDKLELEKKTYDVNGSGLGFCAISIRYAF